MPCLKSFPLTSSWALPTNEITTPTYPIGISVMGTGSTSTSHGSAATIRPIWPGSITVTGTLRTAYCQGQKPKWSPGGSVRAW